MSSNDAPIDLPVLTSDSWDRLTNETEVVGYPVLPVIRQLNEHVPTEYAKFIHWGATTQDIQDTASVLQIRSGLAIIHRYLNNLVSTLTHLSSKYRDTPMPGRTHLQHALPITFGYKCSVYLSSFLRHINRLNEIESRCLIVQFGGAAGTLASLGSDDTGLKVRAQLAVELNLQDPPITWHVVRDTIAETLNYLALLGGSLAKIAYDVMLMSSNEFSEVSEPFVPHRGASSTMPQKRNPISSEVVLAASKLLRSNAGLGLDAMVVDFERASGPWHLEWVAVPESFVVCVGALHQMDFCLAGLVVETGAMMGNLMKTKGLIAGEAVMMGLAPHLGRQRAHDVVYEACKEAIEGGEALIDVLIRKQDVVAKVGVEELKRLCDPTGYLGASGLMVDGMVGKIITLRG